jgi:xylulokinase
MYIGLDAGTSGVKAVLFAPGGAALCRSARNYPIAGTGADLELSPEAVFSAVMETLMEIAATGNEVKAVGISSLGEACVFLDREGRVLRNTILPGDKRGAEFLDGLSGSRADRIAGITGLPLNATYTAFKLLWVQKYEPELYAKIAAVMLYGDYIAWRLTGAKGIGYSLASRTMLFDNKTCAFSGEIFDSLGIDRNLFSPPARADALVGTLRPEIARAANLPPSVKVFAGGHDQPCAAAGAGCFLPGQAVDSMGSSECITPVLGASFLDPAFIKKTNFPAEPFLVDGNYNTMAYTHTAGRLLEWYVQGILNKNDYAGFDRRCKKEPTGLLVLPHFAGAGTPTMDHLSTGAIVGLNLHTDSIAIYQALMENITYEMKLNLDLLAENGIALEEIAAVGGGAKSPVWLQYKADIFGLPVYTLECTEASSLGAAMAAAKGDGAFASLKEAAKAMVKKRRVYEPDNSVTPLFEEQYRRYQGLYAGIKQIDRRV